MLILMKNQLLKVFTFTIHEYDMKMLQYYLFVLGGSHLLELQ
jgi:hypothetical protein